MKNLLLVVINLLLSRLVFASSGHDAHDADHGVPAVVYYQAINVGIILMAGFYYGREKIVGFFTNKKTQFLQAQEKAQATLKQAEKEHHEVKARLDKLKGNKEESLLKAKADATDLKNQIIQDAHALAKKLKDEALLSSKLEIERAKYQLKDQLIREAFEISKKDLSAKATSDDQKKLQEDFISKVQVVQ